MLQWTGGSRRKVYTSRKSTQSRQRQYFEQKRRQQQRPNLQNQNEAGQASNDQEPRSLDVLNINNLATPNSHHGESTNADGAIRQVDCTLSDASPTVAVKKITSLPDDNTKEAGSQPRLSSPFGHQDAEAAVRYHEEPLGCRISPSINYSTRQQNKNLELQSEISLIDLVSYEGSKNKSTAQPAREPHVSFSVKGLGHIKMETPPHSPRPIKRVLPLPPKAMRFTHKAKRSVTFDVTKALDSMNGISMLKEQRPPARMNSILDESGCERRKQFNCNFMDSFKNHNANLYLEDEDMFYEPQAENDWQSKHSQSDVNLANDDSDRLWRIDELDSEDHFHTQRGKHFDTSGYEFKDKYSPERRNPTRCSTRFENTGIPSSHDLFSDHSLMDDDEGMELFERERLPPSKNMSKSNSTPGPSVWSFDRVDDSEKRRSPISEESCSSAAGVKEKTCKKPSSSIKNEMNEDEFHISLDKLDIPNMDADIHAMPLFYNPEKVDRKRTTDQKKHETSYWPESVTEQPRTREPSCRLSLEEKFSNWDAPTSHLKGLTNPSSCTVMHEDKPSFSSAPDLSMYQTVESTEKRPALKVHPVFHGLDNAIFEDDIHMQRPDSDIFSNKNDLSNPLGTKDLQSDIDMGTLFGHKDDKKHESDFSSFSNRNADVFSVKKAASSARQSNGQHSVCSLPSGKDSFRHGFSPGFNFQELEPNIFWEDNHVSHGTFQDDLELNDLVTRENIDKNEAKVQESGKTDTKMLTETCRLSADHRNEKSGTETCSDGSVVSNYSEVQKETSTAATKIPANLSRLKEASAELFQVHTHVIPVTREKLDNPGADFEAPLHSRNNIHNVGDHSKLNDVFQSPFVGEVEIEKKFVASVSPENNDVQYQFMLEQRVLRRLCVQKIVVPTPMKDKLHKDTCFRIVDDGTHVLPKSA